MTNIEQALELIKSLSDADVIDLVLQLETQRGFGLGSGDETDYTSYRAAAAYGAAPYQSYSLYHIRILSIGNKIRFMQTLRGFSAQSYTLPQVLELAKQPTPFLLDHVFRHKEDAERLLLKLQEMDTVAVVETIST